MDEQLVALKKQYQDAYRVFQHAISFSNLVETFDSMVKMTDIALVCQEMYGREQTAHSMSFILCAWRLEVAVGSIKQ